MAEKREEATHRQRAALGTTPSPVPIDEDGRPMVVISCSASDLVPTVQFGNVLVGPVTITRAYRDTGDEQVIEDARRLQQVTEFVVGAERRLVQWAANPASRVINPATGEAFVGDGQQAQQAADVQTGVPAVDEAAPQVPQTPPAADAPNTTSTSSAQPG